MQRCCKYKCCRRIFSTMQGYFTSHRFIDFWQARSFFYLSQPSRSTGAGESTGADLWFLVLLSDSGSRAYMCPSPWLYRSSLIVLQGVGEAEGMTFSCESCRGVFNRSGVVSGVLTVSPTFSLLVQTSLSRSPNGPNALSPVFHLVCATFISWLAQDSGCANRFVWNSGQKKSTVITVISLYIRLMFESLSIDSRRDIAIVRSRRANALGPFSDCEARNKPGLSRALATGPGITYIPDT